MLKKMPKINFVSKFFSYFEVSIKQFDNDFDALETHYLLKKAIKCK